MFGEYDLDEAIEQVERAGYIVIDPEDEKDLKHLAHQLDFETASKLANIIMERLITEIRQEVKEIQKEINEIGGAKSD